jgi:hypothetical protein
MPSRTYYTCTVEGCGRPHEAKGYCNFHYIRARNGKPFSDPVKLSASPHLPICPICRGRVRGNHIEKCKAKRAARGRSYRASHMPEWADYSRAYRQRKHVRAKYLANKKLQWAVSEGHIRKPKRCEDCGKSIPRRKLHGHHEDYSEPLNVVWVCDPCHKARHLALKA